MKFKMLFICSIIAVGAMGLLSSSILTKEKEKQVLNTQPSVNGISEKEKSENWASYYPRQYSSWKRTKEGDSIIDVLEEKPFMAVAFAGYSFAKEFNSPRGHFYAPSDQMNTLKITTKENVLPSLCWSCHSGAVPSILEEEGDLEFYSSKWVDYGPRALHPISCANCHDDKTAELTVKLPFLNEGLQAAGLKTFEESTHQEKRTLVCMQCHVEFYVTKEKWTDKTGKERIAKLVKLPYDNGTSVEEIEEYYDSINHKDYTHTLSKTPMLKATHSYWENWKSGVHGKRNISCADCHMPYTQEGAVKFSDHQVQSPLNTMERSCMTCHNDGKERLQEFVQDKKHRVETLTDITFENLAMAHIETAKAMEVGASDEDLKNVRKLLRSGQWKADMVLADHGSYFHNTEEALKLLGKANDMAQKARIELAGILAKNGVIDYESPSFDTKEKAQKLVKIDYKKLVEDKIKIREELKENWKNEGLRKGHLNKNSVALDPVHEKNPPYYKDINH